ncbi:hypothetical protein GJ699_01920 [Duganella sp. FT80W]|uniref:DP-EP family protein n=1 Tax=Duganella guangzhouensis TaxID=2666084 RepID=A0A6I2KSP0_9BURK|nr:DP-EP family protein [Duganella guangzhouensis]MRW88738.1 hypothetical protein [Duganella guangzhouensis]
MSKLTASTQFLNVLVQVKPGTKPGTQYTVQTAPAIPYVTQPDTVINYQIYDTSGFDIVFTGVTVVPADNDQLSPASVSISGKQLTFTDANTKSITFNIILNFKDKDGVEFSHDPQIQNDPQS